MLRLASRFMLLCTAVVVVVGPVSAQDDENLMKKLESVAIIEQKVMVPMRDGIGLSTDIYRPANITEPVPTIFVRTPYNFNSFRDGERQLRQARSAYEAVTRGYAYIYQNERGRYFSEGEWDILGPPKTDGYDALSWIAEQPWSNGKVGTIGCSSTAEWQMGLAALDHPAHAAMIPQGFGAGVGRVGPFYEQGNWYRGGAEQMLFFAWLYGVQNTQRPMFPKDISREDMVRLSRYFDLAPEMPRVDWSKAMWHLPVEDILRNVDGPKGIFADPAPVATGGRMIQRAPNDPAWYKGGLYHDDEPFGVPSLWWMSWYDVSIGPNLALFNHVTANATDPEVANNQFALVAPVTHCAIPSNHRGNDRRRARYGRRPFRIRRLDLRLVRLLAQGRKERDPRKDTKSSVLLDGQKRMAARRAPGRPEGAEMVTYYLDSWRQGQQPLRRRPADNRRARSRRPSPTASPMIHSIPVTSYGGNVCCTGNAITAGSFDQQKNGSTPGHTRLFDRAADGGRGGERQRSTVTLYVSSDVKRYRLHRQADRRVSRTAAPTTSTRPSYADPLPRGLRPGRSSWRTASSTRSPISPMSTSNWFDAGSSHSYRGFERATSRASSRNMNTGGNNYDETEGIVAHSQVHHSRTHPSLIRLPVVKRQHSTTNN